jgi:allophanate hydrolase subunit 1
MRDKVGAEQLQQAITAQRRQADQTVVPKSAVGAVGQQTGSNRCP